MSDLFDLVKDTFPANNDVGVPLKSDITITLSGLDYNEDSLTEGFFVEGPDTDQFVGPGQIEQLFPNNISQGELDDFLESPGYKGIVQGTVTVSGISGDTVITFDPVLPLFALTDYIVNLTGILDSSEVAIDGFVSFGFETGSGSIETVPDTVSSSVLAASIPEAVAPSTTALSVVSTTPDDRTVEHPIDLNEITIEFNKELDAASVASANIVVQTVPATDHPNANVQSVGDLAKSVEVDGSKLKIKI